MVQQAPVITAPEPEIQVCPHYWQIQPADGPSSNGFCQVCGETREFKNYVESATWGDTRLIGRPSRRQRAEEIDAGFASDEGFGLFYDED